MLPKKIKRCDVPSSNAPSSSSLTTGRPQSHITQDCKKRFCGIQLSMVLLTSIIQKNIEYIYIDIYIYTYIYIYIYVHTHIILESRGGERKLRGGEDDEEGDDDEQEAKRGLSLHDCENKKW